MLRFRNIEESEIDTGIGIAIVAPDRLAAISAKECLKLGAGKVIFSCGVKNIISFLKASSFFGQACGKQPAPKYYLTLLAVDINAQGRGIGTAMIQECIVPFLKEEGCKLLCLNTNEEKNRNFYRKNKFDEIGEAEIEINGKCIDFLWGKADIGKRDGMKKGRNAVNTASALKFRLHFKLISGAMIKWNAAFRF